MRLEFHFFNSLPLPLQLLNGNRLSIEFFDFVGGRGCGRWVGRNLFDFHQSLGDGFGVRNKRVGCTFGLVFILELACLGTRRPIFEAEPPSETALRAGGLGRLRRAIPTLGRWWAGRPRSLRLVFHSWLFVLFAGDLSPFGQTLISCFPAFSPFFKTFYM